MFKDVNVAGLFLLRRIVPLLAGVLLGPACGGFVDSDGTVARHTFGAQGGELQFDVLSINVPAGSLHRTVALSVRRAPFEAPASHAYAVEPPGVVFDASFLADVAIGYDPIAFPHPVNMYVATFDGTEWHPLAQHLPTDLGRAHGLTAQTGTFGLVSCPAGTCPTTSLDGGVDH